MKVFIDLFCGLGGASSAVLERKDWKMIRIDNNPELIPHVHGMICTDLAQVQDAWVIIQAQLQGATEPIDEIFLWMSPPCNQFSLANPNRPDYPDLELVKACRQYKQLIEAFTLEHKIKFHYLIENVKGAIEWFNHTLGFPWHQRIGPIYLWGDAPWIDFKDADEREHKKDFNKGSRSLRANVRAMVPWAVSNALLNAIEYQTSLEDWI